MIRRGVAHLFYAFVNGGRTACRGHSEGVCFRPLRCRLGLRRFRHLLFLLYLLCQALNARLILRNRIAVATVYNGYCKDRHRCCHNPLPQTVAPAVSLLDDASRL